MGGSIKKIVIIYNPVSGKSKKRNLKDEIVKEIERHGYEVEVKTTKYSGHAREIIKSLDDNIYLVLSLGGDGTFNEVVTGNLERKKDLLLGTLPLGTTNDFPMMLGYNKDVITNLRMILKGEVKSIDICTINNHPFVYFAGFGKFMNISYATPKSRKKILGYFAYTYEALKNFLGKTKLYELEYETNGQRYKGLYSLIAVSNANRFAGIGNLYKDIKLDDGLIEIMISNMVKRKHIIRTLYYYASNDLYIVPGISFYRTKELKIRFSDKVKSPWCIDGEKLENKNNTKVFVIKANRKIKLLVPSRTNNELFIK